MTVNQIGVPEGAVLGDALQCPVVDVDQAEPIVIAGMPLQIVGEGPMEVSFYRYAVAAGQGQFLQVRRQKIDAVGIVDLAVPEDTVVAALAVLASAGHTEGIGIQ